MERLPVLLCFVFSISSCSPTSTTISPPVVNMNGEYIISNENPYASAKWSSLYSKLQDVEYFEVYSPLLSTRYGEVFWTMMDPVPLDKDLVARFDGKVLAVVGYETDQVMKTE